MKESTSAKKDAFVSLSVHDCVSGWMSMCLGRWVGVYVGKRMTKS